MPARQVFVEVPCFVKGLAHGGRKSRWQGTILRAPVEIEETAGFDDPEALVLTYERRQYGRKGKETVRRATPGLSKALWRQVDCQEWAGGRATFERLQGDPRAGFMKPNPFAYWNKYRDAGGWKTYDEAMSKMRQVELDNSDRVRASCSRAADRLRVMPDGTLIRKDVEPVWTVRLRGKKVEVEFSRPYPSSLDVGIAFRMDRRTEAEALCKAMAEASDRRTSSSGMTLEKADETFLNWTTQDATLALLRSCAFSSFRNRSRDLRGDDADAASSAMEDFKREMVPGGSMVTAAAVAGRLMGFMDFHTPEMRDSKLRLGEWLETMELAVKLGAVPERIGGIDPEALAAEDDEAIASFTA